MARRHLPIVNNSSPAPASGPAPGQEAESEPPPWHWIPLGTVVSVVVFALLAQGAGKLAVHALGRVYRPGMSPAEMAAVRAAHPAEARTAEILAGGIPVVTLLLAVALGGYTIGRYGPRTNARHGTLSGACTGLLLWAVTGRLWAMLAVVPVAMLAGYLGARGGVHVRDRALLTER